MRYGMRDWGPFEEIYHNLKCSCEGACTFLVFFSRSAPARVHTKLASKRMLLLTVPPQIAQQELILFESAVANLQNQTLPSIRDGLMEMSLALRGISAGEAACATLLPNAQVRRSSAACEGRPRRLPFVLMLYSRTDFVLAQRAKRS